jgi:hypothetical protein
MNRTVNVVVAASSGKLVGMLVGMFAAVALAAEVAGVSLDDRVSVGAQELVLNGAGVRTRVVFKVYVASLYLKSQVEALATIMKSFKEVKEKDVITLDFVDGATRIGLNGEAKGNIGGDAFNQALTKVWLGEKPVQADLKKSLLGG